MSKFPEIWLHTDGASRRNPGLAAIAYRITDASGHELERHAEVIGIATNNEAEYRALIAGMSAAGQFTRDRLRCLSDSELVVKHLNGQNKLEACHLIPLFAEVRRLAESFEHVSFKHRPRSDPGIAQVDRMANEALNRYEKGSNAAT